MMKKKISIQIKVGAKKIFKGIGLALLIALGVFVVCYFFFVGSLV